MNPSRALNAAFNRRYTAWQIIYSGNEAAGVYEWIKETLDEMLSKPNIYLSIDVNVF